MSLFGFAFWANRFGFFAEAQRDYFELLLAFVAFIFIDRHRVRFLFFDNLVIREKKVNTHEGPLLCPMIREIVH